MSYLSVILSIFFSLLLPSIAHADIVPPPPNLAVKAYILKDFQSGNTIVDQASHQRVEPASLTKLMTAYLSFKSLKSGLLRLDQTLPVSTKAWKVEGSKMFIEPNKPVTVDELLHGMIIQSGNDASIALAEGIGVSEEGFVALMNKEAARLGMNDTHFMNATGLPDPQHYTTAYDLSLLASALIKDFPDEYKRLYSQKEYSYNNITQPNRNRLLWLDPYVDGMKTGHTDSAGYCLISSAKRDKTRLISVVLGAVSDTARATESQKLLNYGFQFYESHLIYKAGLVISTFKVWKGSDHSLDATTSNDIYISLPKGDYSMLKAKVTSRQPLIAPVSYGQEIGKIQLILNDKVLEEQALVAGKEVPVAGIFGRMWDSLKLIFQ